MGRGKGGPPGVPSQPNLSVNPSYTLPMRGFSLLYVLLSFFQNPGTKRAYLWLNNIFPKNKSDGTYYHLYGINFWNCGCFFNERKYTKRNPIFPSPQFLPSSSHNSTLSSAPSAGSGSPYSIL